VTCVCHEYEGDNEICPEHGTREPTVWESLTLAGLAATQAAATHQRKKSRKRSRKPECTPCAAQAYVDALKGG